MSYGEISARGFLLILMLAALAGCGPSSSERHWKQITELTGSRWETYFVVTDAQFRERPQSLPRCRRRPV